VSFEGDIYEIKKERKENGKEKVLQSWKVEENQRGRWINLLFSLCCGVCFVLKF